MTVLSLETKNKSKTSELWINPLRKWQSFYQTISETCRPRPFDQSKGLIKAKAAVLQWILLHALETEIGENTLLVTYSRPPLWFKQQLSILNSVDNIYGWRKLFSEGWRDRELVKRPPAVVNAIFWVCWPKFRVFWLVKSGTRWLLGFTMLTAKLT